jgi:hypothetical protein
MNDALTTFVVGPIENPSAVRFRLVEKEGSPNIETLDPLPVLNRNGLLRLAKHLMALAELIDSGQAYRMKGAKDP